MGRPPKAGKRRQMEQQALARQRAEEDVQSIFDKYLPNSVFNDLEIELSECIDTRTCVDSFQFSFERVPIHESWYETYYRQDQVWYLLLFWEILRLKCNSLQLLTGQSVPILPRAWIISSALRNASFHFLPQKDRGGEKEKSRRWLIEPGTFSPVLEFYVKPNLHFLRFLIGEPQSLRCCNTGWRWFRCLSKPMGQGSSFEAFSAWQTCGKFWITSQPYIWRLWGKLSVRDRT